MNNPITTLMDKLNQALSGAWTSANARPPSFDHLSDNEMEIAQGFYDDFADKAERGYFDEDVISDFRQFLFRWGCDKPEVDSACEFMKQIAQNAVPALRSEHTKTQNRYWDATGGADTRDTSILGQ